MRGAVPAAEAAWLSVVMPVRNALPYLDEAIRSILGQSHGDFEFVIGDDASDDGSTERLRGWAARDGRIRLFERRDRLGPAASSNWVVAQASGQLVARMDADDIAHPDRLRRQLAALAARPDAALVGSPPVGIDCRGRLVREQARWAIGNDGFSAPFAHGSILFRRAAFDRAGGYRPQCAYWEDIDLYLRLARVGAVLVLPDPLYFYRFADTSTRLTSNPEQVEQAVALMLRCRARYLEGEDYRDLLDAAGPPPAGRIDPIVFLSIAGGRIWTGASPGVAGRMLRRAAFPRSRESALAWLIMLWGGVSPRSLRAVMRRRLAAHNREAAGRFVDGSLYEWRTAAARGPAAVRGSA